MLRYCLFPSGPWASRRLVAQGCWLSLACCFACVSLVNAAEPAGDHAATRRKSASSRQHRLVPIEGIDLVNEIDPGPAQSLEKKEIRERVQRALSDLEPEDAMVILLRDLQDTAYEDIARVLKIPVGTVKSRLHRARQALKARLAAYVFAGRKAV